MRFEHGEMPIRIQVNNQSMILQMIYHYGPIKRPDIADILGLTRPTITTSVKAMIEKGIVEEITDLTDKDESAVVPGRKAYPVNIVADSQYFIGAEMRSVYRAVCITDYLGNVVYRDLDATVYQDYEKNIQMVSQMISRAMESNVVPKEKIAGIGLCVPGMVDNESGMLRVHPGYNWRDKDMRGDLMSRIYYDGPVTVANNAYARTRSVQMFRREPLKGQSFAYMFISDGIACPLVLNGINSYESVVGLGEVGHTIMVPNGPRCRCGNYGCLEAFSSDQAIIDRCKEQLGSGKAGVLRRLCGDDPVTMGQILEAQAQGDPEVCRIIQKAVYILALNVTNICNFACPNTMFIEGLLFERQENKELLLDVINKNLYSATHAHTDVVFLQPDIYSGAMGAAAVAVKENLENYSEKKVRGSNG